MLSWASHVMGGLPGASGTRRFPSQAPSRRGTPTAPRERAQRKRPRARAGSAPGGPAGLAREGSAETRLRARPHSTFPPHPLPSAPAPLEAGDIRVVPPPVERPRMLVTQAGPENSLGHGRPRRCCPGRLLGGGFGVELERWATLNPQRQELWILDRHRPGL